MRILITGSSGLVGTALIPFLLERGHTVVRAIRDKKGYRPSDTIYWNPLENGGDPSNLENFDAVINLSGENVASERWSAAKKQRIRDSRVQSTQALCQALSERKKPPRVLVSASAIGYYGDQGNKLLIEESANGQGFLAQACREWEAANEPALKCGIRIVMPRIGMVLSEKGGALPRILTPFRLGLGGRLGSGKQYMSWISLEDLVRLIYFAITQEHLHGAVNATAPNPVTNEEFTRILGHFLHRPTFLPVPAFVIKFALGEMGEQLLLSSAKVYPKRALEAGFSFHHPVLADALRA